MGTIDFYGLFTFGKHQRKQLQTQTQMLGVNEPYHLVMTLNVELKLDLYKL